MKLTYDKVADALYFYFRKGKVFRTKKLTPGLFVDVSKNGQLIGFEILDASKKLGFKTGRRSNIEIPIPLNA